MVVCQIVLIKKFRLWPDRIKRIFENKNLKILFFSFLTVICINNIIYKNLLEEFEKDKKENVIHILTYSFTEILNNAIEHSESKDIKI